MNRKEYDLVYTFVKTIKFIWTKISKILSEQILDDLYYPREVEDRLDTDKTGQEFREELDVFDEIVADAHQNEPEINGVKSLNFRIYYE